jgi:transcriptional regulator with XRE-family HTH domain
MSQNQEDLKNLRDFIKFKLRLKGLTYKQLAKKLKLSEVTVKRWMSDRAFTILDLVQMGKVLDFGFFEVIRSDYSNLGQFSKFSHEQESHLVRHPQHQLLLIKLRDGLELNAACEKAEITLSAALKYLRALEEQELLEFWPGDKIKIKLKGPFQLLKDGPIAKIHFAKLRDYLFEHFKKNFPPLSEIESPNSLRTFRPFEFSLTEGSNRNFVRELESLIGKYDQISTFECARKEKVEPVSVIIAVDRHDAWKNVLHRERSLKVSENDTAKN